jgi:serine/threonine kinase 32
MGRDSGSTESDIKCCGERARSASTFNRTDTKSSAISINATPKPAKSSNGSPSSGSPSINIGGDKKSSGTKLAPPIRTATIDAGPSKPRSASVGTRSASVGGGGMQIVLDESGSWSNLAEKNTTAPSKGKHGMLGFLSKRKGRASSPKPLERGVLGREGARVIIA